MQNLMEPSQWLRSLLSGGAPSAGAEFCLDKDVSYAHRVDNVAGWNWCLVPDGGYDAVFFAGVAIAVMCLASPRWDALIVLFFGGIYFTFSYYYNLEHVSNAVMLWLGMRPADIFVFVFLPPFLLDASVRIDFFMLKKVAFNIAFMAFVMVAASALLLIPFMLYALDLSSSGWTAGYVALFGSMIASTDAASVSAVLRGGGGSEILSVLLEGESLFNDASSLTLFEIFKEVVLEDAKTTLAHDLQGIVEKTVWSAFTGICIGLAMGIFTRWIFAWLQHRNMEATAEVAWSVAGAYLSFYITQVWCKGSGCIGAVVFGLYGSSTLLWGMSTKARLTGIFTQFWAVMAFVINGLIFFYVGASSVNFTIRSARSLYVDSGGIPLVKILLYKLPLIFLASFALRFILIFVSFKLFQLVRLSEGLSIQEVIFVTVGGLRGSLSLVLAQSAATLASTHTEDETNRRVKAEIAIYTAGYVIMTLLINAPLCGPLLTLLGLDKVRQEQLAMRGEVKNLFRKFSLTAIEDLAAGQDEDELLQGLDWAMLKLHTNFDKQLDNELPEVQPRVRWVSRGYWLNLFTAPLRLGRHLAACLRGRCNPDALELESRDDRQQQALNRQQQEAELKRATNINLREINRGESRAPGPPSRLLSSLVIRDSSANISSAGTRGLTSPAAYSTSAGASGRRPSSAVAVGNSGLRRNNSHRLSSLVVGPPGAAGGGVNGIDREPSVHGRVGFNRSNSRFLEGAVAGPAICLLSSQQQQPVSPNGGDNGGLPPVLPLVIPETPSDGGCAPGTAAAATCAAIPAAVSDGTIVEEAQIDVVLSAPLPLPLPRDAEKSQRLEVAPVEQQAAEGEQQQAQAGDGDDGGGRDGLVDAELLLLARAQEERSAEAAVVSAATRHPSKMSSRASGGDSLIEAALMAASSPSGLEAPELPPLQQQLSGTQGPPPSPPLTARPRLSAPSSPRLSNPVARPSPLSRVAVGGGGNGSPSAGFSRLHPSASLPKLSTLDQRSSEVAASGPVLAGATSEPEPVARHASGSLEAAGGDRGLLQSVLVIKPGRGSALPTSSIGPSAGVRLVQRLGDDGGRGSALEALRTDTLTAGGRGLGRGSVRLGATTAQSPQQQQQQEPPAADSEVSMVPPWGGAHSTASATAAGPAAAAAADRPLGRTSLSAPTAGRSLGRSSGVFPAMAEGGLSSVGSMPLGPSPFEFVMPPDEGAAGPSFGDAFHAATRGGGGDAAPLGRGSVRQGAADGGLGRSSIRAGGGAADGGGLARPSTRQGAAGGGGGGGGGGGALSRGSVRLGRQGGLAAVSTHLARIYDTDSTSTAAAADGVNGRLALAAPEQIQPMGSSVLPQRASITGAPCPSPTLPGHGLGHSSNSHIALQMQSFQQRESSQQQQQQLASQSLGAAQYSLGVTGNKNVLMSLIRRSASQNRSQTDRGSGGGGGGGRDQSGRSPELGRRTRFAEGSAAAALARASASGALRQSSSEIDAGGGGSAGVCDPLLVEYRLRLLTGLKQYYKQKHAAGSLSPSAYKVLSYIADQSAHHPEEPLQLWAMAKKEISSGPVMEVEVALYFKLKQWTAAAKASSVTLVRTVVPRLLVPFVRLISSHTSAATLRGLETAVELWASLTQSLQTEWLQYSGVYGERLLDEVQHEADGAWAYIIERRIESPKKFGAVQTHRAVIDVLTQQQAFVKSMNEGGMIEESECRMIVEMVEKRLQLLARRGPRWRQPTVMDILMGTAVLRGVSPKVVEWIRKNSTFRVYPQGAAIWDMGRKQAGAEPDGLIIVIRGVVRMMLEQEGALVPYYLGAGGVGGLVSCVLESHVPGMSSAAAYAEGNALGKGPLVMHVPWSVLQVLKRLSREEGLAQFQALDLQMYRTAAVYVLDLLRQQVTQQFSAFIRSSLLTILSSQRLDGPMGRRQRIRLLLQPAAADYIVDGAIDWIGELLSTDLEVARMLLEPNGVGSNNNNNNNIAATATTSSHHHHHSSHHYHHSHHHHHNGLSSTTNTSNHSSHQRRHLSHHVSPSGSGGGAAAAGVDVAAAAAAAGDGGASPTEAEQQQNQQMTLARLIASPWVEVMYKAIAAATGAVLDIIRTSLKDSLLVVLGPGQGIIQGSTMVLIQGSLEPAHVAEADGAGGGPFVASSNEFHVAPSVMVWVSDYFAGELVAQKELRVMAGPQGATLLLWGVRPEDLLINEPAKGGAAELPPSKDSGGGAAASAAKKHASANKSESDPGRGILSVSKSRGTRARQESGKGKTEATAVAKAPAMNGGIGGGEKDGGEPKSPSAGQTGGRGR